MEDRTNMSEEQSSVGTVAPLTNVWVNVAGTQTQVLKGATGTWDQTNGIIVVTGGSLSGSGITKGSPYDIGADQTTTKSSCNCYSVNTPGLTFAFTT